MYFSNGAAKLVVYSKYLLTQQVGITCVLFLLVAVPLIVALQ